MKRDMDLVRKILREAAESNGPLDASAFVSDDTSFAFVAYHVKIMEDADLIEARILRAKGSGTVIAEILNLTWEGQDFLDSVRSDDVWSKTKMTIAKAAGAASLEVTKSIAEGIAAGLVKAQM
jgi:hypothetical protein